MGRGTDGRSAPAFKRAISLRACSGGSARWGGARRGGGGAGRGASACVRACMRARRVLACLLAAQPARLGHTGNSIVC